MAQGRAVQVAIVKAGVESAYGFQHLKLEYDEPLSNFAFNSNLRRFIKEPSFDGAFLDMHLGMNGQTMEAGAYSRPLFSST